MIVVDSRIKIPQAQGWMNGRCMDKIIHNNNKT
jgi:hypothetical protein